jgi:hypothetical protein
MGIDRRSDGDDTRVVRNIGKWMAAFALFLVLLATLVSLQAFQLTAEGPSLQTLRRTIAVTTEIDALIDRNYDDLQRRAEASDAGDVLILRDYPIDVPLTREEALGASPDELRELLLSRSAALMYEDGTGVLRDADGSGRPGRFNAAGLIDSFLDVQRDGTHTAFGVTTIVLAALSALLAMTLAALCRGFGRLAAIGAVTVAASLPVLLFGLLGRASSPDSDTEYIERELIAIGESLAWIPIRNGLAFVAFGAILLIAGIVGARIADARSSARDDSMAIA